MPCLVERIHLTPAHIDERTAGLDLLTRMVASHDALDEAAGRPHRPKADIVVDRGFTSETRGYHTFIGAIRALGYATVHDLTEHQRGHTRTLPNGALVIDGQPYSPAPRSSCARSPRPRWRPPAEIAAYQELIARRAPYSLAAIGATRPDGSRDYGCRALAAFGKLICDRKPTSLGFPLDRIVTDPGLDTGEPPAVCAQGKVLQAHDLPYGQHLPYGSIDWYGRSTGATASKASSATTRPTLPRTYPRPVRRHGHRQAALMIAFIIAASNLRLLDTWKDRQDPPQRAQAEAAGQPAPVKRTRTARPHTRARQQMAEYIASPTPARRDRRHTSPAPNSRRARPGHPASPLARDRTPARPDSGGGGAAFELAGDRR